MWKSVEILNKNKYASKTESWALHIFWVRELVFLSPLLFLQVRNTNQSLELVSFYLNNLELNILTTVHELQRVFTCFVEIM